MALDGSGWTPLHVAAKFGICDLVEVLLAHGADTTIRLPNNGKTPLNVAAKLYEDVLEMRINSAINQNHAPGRDPADLTAEYEEHLKTIRILIKKSSLNDIKQDQSRRLRSLQKLQPSLLKVLVSLSLAKTVYFG